MTEPPHRSGSGSPDIASLAMPRGEPEQQWVECSVRVPGTAGEIEVKSLAKVRCDDVIDALDLPRWVAVAFQHIWRSAKRTSQRELGLALWYLKRATTGHHAEARIVARVLRHLVALSERTAMPMHDLVLRLAQDLEAGEFAALEMIHDAATKEP